MRLRTKGKTRNVHETLVGRVTRNVENPDKKNFLLLENSFVEKTGQDFSAYITTSKENSLYLHHLYEPIVFDVSDVAHLNEGDIVSIDNIGNINTLYRINSFQNSLLVTERCNSNCLMCSQPPKDRDDIDYYFTIHKKLISLIPKDCVELGITGGEPTLMEEKFYELIILLKSELPDTNIHILTNGRSFAWSENAKKMSLVEHNKVMLGIPLYSDYYASHDYIVQAKNAFYQTVIGLHNLARYNQRIEIRIVLHKLTIPRLTKLAEYIYRNFPFAEHIAFMGLENIGYTPYNFEKLWIDPADYMSELNEAVSYLDSFGMNVSIYNLQLCILPKQLWKFARKSISDWKNIYIDECTDCYERNNCGGFFASNLNAHSKHIKAIQISVAQKVG